MEKKTIAIVANTTWNIYNFRLNIIDRLIAQGYDVVVIAPIDKYIHYKEQYKTIIHLPLKYLKRDGVNPIRDIAFMLELYRIYRRIKPDLILHYTVKPNIYGGIAARLNRLPSLGVVTGLGYAFIHNGYIELITKWLYRFSAGFHKRLIFENQDDRRLFIDENIIKAQKGISIKGCGVNTQYFQPMPQKINKDKVIFTFIGRLIYDKGISEFVQAARKINETYTHVEFWLVGEIDKQNPAAVRTDDLNAWVKEKTIIYKGATNDVRPYIVQSDCVVLPSYREAIARSITEAMAMEKPVIATDVPGCKEAVEHGKNGFLVEKKNATDLSLAMERFLETTTEERQSMGKYGRSKVLREFDDRLIAKNITDLIIEILRY